MGMWIFILAMNLLIPLTMIGVGRYFINSAGPKEINMISGYRTTMSMKNKDTWQFAHIYHGRLCRIMGWVLTPLVIITMLLVMGREGSTVETTGTILIIAQIVLLILSIIPTEMALRRTFDKDGNRRN